VARSMRMNAAVELSSILACLLRETVVASLPHYNLVDSTIGRPWGRDDGRGTRTRDVFYRLRHLRSRIGAVAPYG
jgi:hypothetical protein